MKVLQYITLVRIVVMSNPMKQSLIIIVVQIALKDQRKLLIVQ